MVIVLTVLTHMGMEHFTELVIKPNVDKLTHKHLALQYMAVAGMFLSGIYYVINNGRNFVDDCTRFV
jgi:hypothetical protein